MNQSRPIVLSELERHELEHFQPSPSVPAGLMRRARAVLLMAAHVSRSDIAQHTGYTPVQISRIRRRFAETGIAGLEDRARSWSR